MKTSELLDAFDWSRFERVIVLSPHLDDAALSCGALLAMLRGLVSRLVVTVSCANPGPWRKHQRLGYAPPADRRRSDIAAMHAIDCDFVHLGFADCVYRRSPTTGKLIYRGPRARWRPPAADDRAYIDELYLVLRRLCHGMGRFLLLSPMAIGAHVDHLICAKLALKLAGKDTPLLFYEDFPYVVVARMGQATAENPRQAAQRLDLELHQRFVVPYAVPVKARFLAQYETEIPVLFGDQQQMKEKLAFPVYHGRPAEVYWDARGTVAPATLGAKDRPPRKR